MEHKFIQSYVRAIFNSALIAAIFYRYKQIRFITYLNLIGLALGLMLLFRFEIDLVNVSNNVS